MKEKVLQFIAACSSLSRFYQLYKINFHNNSRIDSLFFVSLLLLFN